MILLGIASIFPTSQIHSLHQVTLITFVKPLQLSIARTYHKEHKCIKPRSVCNTMALKTPNAPHFTHGSCVLTSFFKPGTHYQVLCIDPDHSEALLFFVYKEIFPGASLHPNYMGVL